MIEDNEKKHCFYKYLGLFFATLIGAFLAVYVVTDIAINRFMDPFAAMHKIDKEFKKMDAIIPVGEIPPQHMRGYFEHKMLKSNIVNFAKTPDAYKFFINLKTFNGNPEDIKITTDDNTITISGESTVDKKDSESFTSFSQTYTLDENANLEKMSKKKVHNKYVITIPMED